MRWTDRPCRTGGSNGGLWAAQQCSVGAGSRKGFVCPATLPRIKAGCTSAGCSSHQGTNTQMGIMEAGKSVFVHAFLLHRNIGAILLRDRLSQQLMFSQPMKLYPTREACLVPQIMRAYSDLLAQSRRSGTWDGGSGSIKVRLSEMAGHSRQRISTVVLTRDSMRT